MTQSWIRNYVQYTRTTASSDILRTWAGVWAVGGLLERKAWINTAAGPLYPNIFVLLVAPPGIGKGMALEPMRDILTASGRVNLAPSSVSNKGMLDYMKDRGKKFYLYDGEKVEYNSMLISSSELGVLLPRNDTSMISILCELYDCLPLFNERIRGNTETLILVRPHIHLIAATQPKYLHNLLPEDAFQQGIMARMIMVYSSEMTKIELFGKTSRDPKVREELITGARKIASYIGPISVEPEAIKDIERVHLTNEGGPDHNKLQHYCTRRTIHMLKIAMAFAASRLEEKLKLTLEDWISAKKLLMATENLMEEIFKEMTTGGQRGEIDEAFHFLFRAYSATKKPIQESILINFLSTRIPTYQIQNLIEIMIKGGILKVSTAGGLPVIGERLLIPVALNATKENV